MQKTENPERECSLLLRAPRSVLSVIGAVKNRNVFTPPFCFLKPELLLLPSESCYYLAAAPLAAL